MSVPGSSQIHVEPGMFRMLHWVFKIGGLKASLDFYQRILGMHILRHEEFFVGCDASCNGPYARPWSKTMIGWGPEKTSFVFELTYNYGIHTYERGDDLRGIAISAEPARSNAIAAGYPIENIDGSESLVDPDGYRWMLVNGDKTSFVHSVVLNTPSLDRAAQFWCGVLGMHQIGEASKEVANFGFNDNETTIQFHRTGVEKINHGAAYGRVAIAAAVGTEPIHKVVLASGDHIQHGPLKLETEGKATVEVIILQDRDGYEICFVEMGGFDELSKPVVGADLVDWKKREEFGGR